MFWTPFSRIFPALFALVCVVAFSGCAANTVPSGSHYVVSVSKASFYKFGPAQAGGPDFSLNEGTKIIMLDHAFGYSRVMTADGTAGYVSTDDVKPAPPGTFTTSRNVSTNYTTQLNRPMFEQPKGPVKHSDVPASNAPLFDPGDNPLPQTPEPKKPGFHF